ncbi:MAG: hypothetical protein LBM96_06100 [Methanobrevibacter sp.]|jgi:hypothetical protein|nr:hypothetical protein [Candidatus Methanoflexus mossambicus]
MNKKQCKNKEFCTYNCLNPNCSYGLQCEDCVNNPCKTCYESIKPSKFTTNNYPTFTQDEYKTSTIQYGVFYNTEIDKNNKQ